MKSDFFKDGNVRVGNKVIPFIQRVIHDRYLLWVPEEFVEERHIVSHYTYLFSQDKSPLSIAIKYSAATTLEDRERQIGHYFSQALETLECMTREQGGVYYRETVTSSSILSVYSLRFAAVMGDGILFGCFNCSAPYRDHWRDVVLQSLHNIEEKA